MKLLEDGYCTVMIDGRHRRRFVEMLREKTGGERVSKPLRKCYAFRVDDKAILLAQKITLSNIAYILTAFRQHETTLSVAMQSLPN